MGVRLGVPAGSAVEPPPQCAAGDASPVVAPIGQRELRAAEPGSSRQIADAAALTQEEVRAACATKANYHETRLTLRFTPASSWAEVDTLLAEPARTAAPSDRTRDQSSHGPCVCGVAPQLGFTLRFPPMALASGLSPMSQSR